MSVRAKMFCQHIQPGKVGATASFNAVWEGTNELQKISENAIFGDATPSGTMWLTVPDARADLFEKAEEYYIDLLPNRAQHHPSGALAHCTGHLAFRSQPDPNYPEGASEFRYVFEGMSGGLSMHVRNPAAIAWLDAEPEVFVAVRLARGRKSDAEIALRQAQVDEMQTVFRQGFGNRYRHHTDPPDETEEQYVERNLTPYRRKLAIAKGEL